MYNIISIRLLSYRPYKNKYEYIFLGYVVMLSINSQILNLKTQHLHGETQKKRIC